MKISRLRSISILAVFVCIPGVSAIVAQQDDPKVAQNIGESRSIPSDAAKTSGTTKANVPKFLDSASVTLGRVGVQTAQPLPLSLQDAIRRALESNNDIEVSRGDVRYQETQVRSLIGI